MEVDLLSKREELKEIIDDMPEEYLDMILKFIDDNFEIVPSEEDIKAFERGKREIEQGLYKFI
ncbi:hypothetical protein DEAC_c07650 [Desulfosporosinus acididurans]|uniref:Uncharacterized protein n=1 Tax=Desulfosporosinus acididurans TaxID=476652 RepID=A0A0J1ISB7_9FIRM|nr:hypothetical protein [Desulfosporosinus acididurans]KLU67551.1 hypothetical protein DEAC_c07650 [Desulfosporosinus acididurans]